MIIDYADVLEPFAAGRIDAGEAKRLLEALRRLAQERPLPVFATTRPTHADVVWALSQAPAASEPAHVRVYSRRQRTPAGGFPATFPGAESYAKGFGAETSPAWLRAHVPEYSGVTFRTHRRSDEPLWDRIEIHGPVAPGTMLVQRPRRDDVRPRIGTVVGARPADDEVDVMWAPWTFKGEPWAP